MSSETFTIPADPDEADDMADELGELATSAEWRRAALVFARVRCEDGPGRPSSEMLKSDLLSPRQYADLGIHGLRSATTVRRYFAGWESAVIDGMAQPCRLGDEVEIPTVEWADYYNPPVTARSYVLTPDVAEYGQQSWRERNQRDRVELDQRPPRVDPITANARALKVFELLTRGLERAIQEILKRLDGITDWDHTEAAALRRIERIRSQLNTIERRVRGKTDDA